MFNKLIVRNVGHEQFYFVFIPSHTSTLIITVQNLKFKKMLFEQLLSETYYDRFETLLNINYSIIMYLNYIITTRNLTFLLS